MISGQTFTLSSHGAQPTIIVTPVDGLLASVRPPNGHHDYLCGADAAPGAPDKWLETGQDIYDPTAEPGWCCEPARQRQTIDAATGR
jgi:hypothetical protein